MTDPVRMRIPEGPLEDAPTGLIEMPRGHQPSRVGRACQMAIDEATDGLPLGAYDRRILAWLAGFDGPTVATICSIINRARTAGLARDLRAASTADSEDHRND